MGKIVDKFLVSATQNLWIQLLRYFFVGGCAFIVDFGLLYILTEYVGVYYLLSASISFIVGLIVNYFISVKWVFDRRIVTNRVLEFFIFALIGVIGLGLNALIIWMFTEGGGCYYMLSKIISTAIVFIWNFVARRFILFNK